MLHTWWCERGFYTGMFLIKCFFCHRRLSTLVIAFDRQHAARSIICLGWGDTITLIDRCWVDEALGIDNVFLMLLILKRLFESEGGSSGLVACYSCCKWWDVLSSDHLHVVLLSTTNVSLILIDRIIDIYNWCDLIDSIIDDWFLWRMKTPIMVKFFWVVH